MGMFHESFKEGYYDGHGQAIENVRHNIIEYIKKNKEISIDKINEICDFCAKIDEDYLNQLN